MGSDAGELGGGWGRGVIDRRLWWASLVICVLGIGVAGYLVYVHYAGIAPICSISHGCEIVQSSKYSKIVGVPVAVIGLIGYVAILASLFFRGEPARMATAAMALIGLGFSGWLTYAEGALIHAWCQWCLSSAGLMTLLAIVSVWRLLIVPPLPETVEPPRNVA